MSQEVSSSQEFPNGVSWSCLEKRIPTCRSLSGMCYMPLAFDSRWPPLKGQELLKQWIWDNVIPGSIISWPLRKVWNEVRWFLATPTPKGDPREVEGSFGDWGGGVISKNPHHVWHRHLPLSGGDCRLWFIYHHRHEGLWWSLKESCVSPYAFFKWLISI